LLGAVARLVEIRSDPLSLVDDAVLAARWVSENRESVDALMDIVATACEEAEVFTRLSGPQKQAYARDLVFIVLDEGFGVVFQGAARVFAEVVVEFVIDFVVSVNNKRGAFTHRR
jgi:hypothetical protein